MKLKIKFIFCMMCMFALFSKVSASELSEEEYYYSNSKGVNFTKQEYDFISNFYFEGFQDYMTPEDYESFVNSDIMNGEIKTAVLEDTNLNKILYYETPMKILKVSSSCSTNCIVVTSLTWKSKPAVKSYDHIGAFFENTSLVGSVKSYLLSGNTYVSSSYDISNASGIASAIKLPDTNEALNIVQEFSVKKSGSINVSYQHARKNISLANSKRFKISRNGYGGVFDYDEDITNYYDAMGGLTLNLA